MACFACCVLAFIFLHRLEELEWSRTTSVHRGPAHDKLMIKRRFWIKANEVTMAMKNHHSHDGDIRQEKLYISMALLGAWGMAFIYA
jgi:hypothetical protein